MKCHLYNKKKVCAYLAVLARAWLFLRLLRAAGRLRGWPRFVSFLFFAPLLCYSKLSWHSSRTPPSSERAEKPDGTPEELRRAGGCVGGWGWEGGWERDGGGGRGATSGREERARRRWKGSNTFMSGLTDGLNLLSCADGDQQRGKQKRRWNKSSSAQFHAGLKVVFSNPAALGVDRPGGSQKWERAHGQLEQL